MKLPELEPAILSKLSDYAMVGLIVLQSEKLEALYMNTKAKEILNLTGDQSLDAKKLIPPKEKAGKYRTFSLDILEHEGLFQDTLIQKANNQLFIGSCGVRHLEVDDMRYILLMIQDTTLQAKMLREIENKQSQIKEAYEELLEQNKQLKELDIAKTRFIALVTHELRTPTSAVVATSEMLKLGLYDNEEQMKEFVGMIYQEGQHLLELINDILDYAKIQSDRMDYFIERADIRGLIKETFDTFKVLAEQSQINIQMQKMPEELLCYFDPHRTNQVLKNLISNAIKYNEAGGSVDIFTETADRFIRIHIKDSGKGISEDNQKLIFNEFETLGKMSTHSKGTGLGLPIAKRMIQAMGGDIGVHSTIGEGSDFWIDIPLDKVLEDETHYRSRNTDSLDDLAA